MNMGVRRNRSAPRRETLLHVKDVIAVRTSGYRPGGLRCDFDRLSEAERRRAVELVGDTDRGTWNWDRLGKPGKGKRGELEELIEKASGEPGIFARARELDEIAALAAEVNRQAVRRPFSRREQATLFEALGEALAGGAMSVSTLGTFVVLLLSLERGEGFAPHSRVERRDGEPVLIVSRTYGILTERQDWRQSLTAWQQGCKQLAKNSWIQLDASGGNEYEIRLGVRAKRAMKGAPPKKRAA
jgi:hypothetical protein